MNLSIIEAHLHFYMVMGFFAFGMEKNMKLSKSTASILTYLKKHAKNGKLIASNARIATGAGVSDRTVQTATNYLRDHGLIEKNNRETHDHRSGNKKLKDLKPSLKDKEFKENFKQERLSDALVSVQSPKIEIIEEQPKEQEVVYLTTEEIDELPAPIYKAVDKNIISLRDVWLLKMRLLDKHGLRFEDIPVHLMKVALFKIEKLRARIAHAAGYICKLFYKIWRQVNPFMASVMTQQTRSLNRLIKQKQEQHAQETSAYSDLPNEDIRRQHLGEMWALSQLQESSSQRFISQLHRVRTDRERLSDFLQEKSHHPEMAASDQISLRR